MRTPPEKTESPGHCGLSCGREADMLKVRNEPQAALEFQGPRSTNNRHPHASAVTRPPRLGPDDEGGPLHSASPGPTATPPPFTPAVTNRLSSDVAHAVVPAGAPPPRLLRRSSPCDLSVKKPPRAGARGGLHFLSGGDGSQRSTLALSPISGAPPVRIALAILTRATALPGLSHSSPRSGVTVSRRIVGSF